MLDHCTFLPAVPAPEHAAFCVHHDGGSHDDTCNGQRWNLVPAESPELEPGRIWIQAFRYSALAADFSQWTEQPAQVELSVEGGDGMATSTLTPAEARRVAAELLNAADQADAVTR